MSQRVYVVSKLKPIGVGEAKASLNRAQVFNLLETRVSSVRPETG